MGTNGSKYPLAIAAAALVSLGAVGCTSNNDGAPAPSETVTVTATPAPTPAPTATATALVIPDCEQLLPIEEVQQYEPWSRVMLLQSSEGTALAADLPGPAAREAAARASQNRGCLLGVPQSDAGLGVYTLEIAPETRDDLIEALRADEAYTESDIEGAPSFAIATEEGMGGSTVSYAFAGDAWIILRGTLIDIETASRVAAPVLASLRAANPGLG